MWISAGINLNPSVLSPLRRMRASVVTKWEKKPNILKSGNTTGFNHFQIKTGEIASVTEQWQRHFKAPRKLVTVVKSAKVTATLRLYVKYFS